MKIQMHEMYIEGESTVHVSLCDDTLGVRLTSYEEYGPKVQAVLMSVSDAENLRRALTILLGIHHENK